MAICMHMVWSTNKQPRNKALTVIKLIKIFEF
jgi:hypothetical protein